MVSAASKRKPNEVAVVPGSSLKTKKSTATAGNALSRLWSLLHDQKLFVSSAAFDKKEAYLKQEGIISIDDLSRLTAADAHRSLVPLMMAGPATWLKDLADLVLRGSVPKT
jgi:hypothetical protein